MNKLFLLFCFIISSLSSSAKETFYYKQTKIIKVGNVDKQASGGQYITFLSGVCYESNNKGVGIGHGSLKIDKSRSTSSITTYFGSSYWGNNTEFRFSYDLSKLNVCLEDGTVYVYTRTTPPANQKTCSLIRKKESGGGAEVVTPTPGGSTSGGSITPLTPIGGQEANPRTPSKRWKNVRRTYDCDRCHHSGKCQTCNGKGWYQGTYGPIDCPNCDGYKTGRCSKCHGSGTIEKIEQVFE